MRVRGRRGELRCGANREERSRVRSSEQRQGGGSARILAIEGGRGLVKLQWKRLRRFWRGVDGGISGGEAVN